jgi:hypothetical protein
MKKTDVTALFATLTDLEKEFFFSTCYEVLACMNNAVKDEALNPKDKHDKLLSILVAHSMGVYLYTKHDTVKLGMPK